MTGWMPAGGDVVEVRAGAQPGGMALQTEAANEGPPEYPDGGETANRGAEWALGNLRRQIEWLVASSSGNASWNLIAQHAEKAGVSALAFMAEEVAEGERPPLALTQYAVELAVVIRAASTDGGHHPVLPSRLGEGAPESGNPENYPFLAWSLEPRTKVKDSLRVTLDEAAASWGGPWLAFASRAAVEKMAEEDPGGLLGEVSEMIERTAATAFESKMSSNQLKILRAFFANA